MRNLLILHGWGCDATVYADLSERLSNGAQRYNVMIPELPGFGKTPEPPEAWGVSDYADYVFAFCEEARLFDKTIFESPPVILAHSLGCRIATKLLAEQRISPLKVIYTGAAGVKPKRTAGQRFRTRLFKAKKFFLKPFPKAVEKMRQKYGSEDYRNASPIMRQTLVKIVNEDLTPLFSKIKQDVLLVWGENDDSTPIADARLMEELMPNAGLAIIKNAGHYAFLDQPELFVRILDSYL